MAIHKLSVVIIYKYPPSIESSWPSISYQLLQLLTDSYRLLLFTNIRLLLNHRGHSYAYPSYGDHWCQSSRAVSIIINIGPASLRVIIAFRVGTLTDTHLNDHRWHPSSPLIFAINGVHVVRRGTLPLLTFGKLGHPHSTCAFFVVAFFFGGVGGGGRSSWLFVMWVLMYAFIVLVLFWLSSWFWCW